MTEFSFKIYNRRHNNCVVYRLRKTNNGWQLLHIAINGECKPDGADLFYENFKQDYINFPSGFGVFLEHVWSQLDNEQIETNEAQVKLQELADWISACEKSQPVWSGFNLDGASSPKVAA